jgi:uncharacterized repeat protein (TIGR01451 family)
MILFYRHTPGQTSQAGRPAAWQRRIAAPLASLLIALGAGAQTPAPALEVTTTAEVEQVQTVNGHAAIHLLPADHVVPGDLLIYTLKVRNTARDALATPEFVAAIPEHTSYVADSAVGPGVEVLYSVDGGQIFDKPPNLRVHGEGGALRPATAADYTHIRWTLKHSLKSKSVAYARFRARLN